MPARPDPLVVPPARCKPCAARRRLAEPAPLQRGPPAALLSRRHAAAAAAPRETIPSAAAAVTSSCCPAGTRRPVARRSSRPAMTQFGNFHVSFFCAAAVELGESPVVACCSRRRRSAIGGRTAEKRFCRASLGDAIHDPRADTLPMLPGLLSRLDAARMQRTFVCEPRLPTGPSSNGV